ncbi:MAG: ribosome recycling factor [Clostridia bacterium]|nr:ribosome recycling factor [Clostridia bacterium]
MKLDNTPYENKMKKSISIFEEALLPISAGRANPGVLNGVTVDYYGVPTAINQAASIKVTDARTMVITPYDASLLKGIEKAILIADVGVVPQNDGKVIRMVFPQATEERRKQLCKEVAKMGEDCKVNLRNIRRDANDKIRDMKKNSEMTEDEQKASEKSTQELTDKYIKDVDAIVTRKQKELMTI